MGNSCCKDGAAPNVVVNPTTNIHRNRPDQSSNSRPNVAQGNNQNMHPLINNQANQRYAAYFEVLRERHSGKGIKTTFSYTSSIPMEEITKKRSEFWETRTEGSPAIWQVLRNACETDEETALAIVNAMSLKLIHKTLQHCYDAQGNIYEIPIFCINDPVSFKIPKKKHIKKEDLTDEIMHIKIRRAGVPHDVEIDIPHNASAAELKLLYLGKVNEGLVIEKLRLFFGGKELVDDALLAENNIQNEHVIQVLIRP